MADEIKAGDWVLGQWNGGSLWFPGVVHSVSGGEVAIKYDDGTSDIRPANQVKPYDWHVGSRIHAIWSGNGGWYDAVISAVAEDGSTITVTFDDGIVEKAVPGRCRSV